MCAFIWSIYCTKYWLSEIRLSFLSSSAAHAQNLSSAVIFCAVHYLFHFASGCQRTSLVQRFRRGKYVYWNVGSPNDLQRHPPKEGVVEKVICPRSLTVRKHFPVVILSSLHWDESDKTDDQTNTRWRRTGWVMAQGTYEKASRQLSIETNSQPQIAKCISKTSIQTLEHLLQAAASSGICVRFCRQFCVLFYSTVSPFECKASCMRSDLYWIAVIRWDEVFIVNVMR